MKMMITGIAYPLEINPVTGNLKTATDADLVQGHIISVLQTEPLESPMRPRYGVPGLLFESEQNFDEYVADVRRRLTTEIPLATFATTGSLGDEGEALINVYWYFNGVEQETITVELN